MKRMENQFIHSVSVFRSLWKQTNTAKCSIYYICFVGQNVPLHQRWLYVCLNLFGNVYEWDAGKKEHTHTKKITIFTSLYIIKTWPNNIQSGKVRCFQKPLVYVYYTLLWSSSSRKTHNHTYENNFFDEFTKKYLSTFPSYSSILFFSDTRVITSISDTQAQCMCRGKGLDLTMICNCLSQIIILAVAPSSF